VWEPGTRRWLVERRRIVPVIGALQRATDPEFAEFGRMVAVRWPQDYAHIPLFRRAGLTLDEA
jgi:hypothetical protein